MLDSIRNLGLSKEEKRQEAITAYLDDILTPKERERFENQMTAEPALRAEVEAQQRLKNQLRQLPRLVVPRNYTLDPVAYGQPERANALLLYPILRGATVMAGLLFVVALSAQLLFGSQNAVGLKTFAPAAEMDQAPADESFAAEAERAASEPAVDEHAEEVAIQEAPVSETESEDVVEEEPAEIVVTVELEAEEAEMPAEESAAAGIPAESPAIGESEADRAPETVDDGMDTATLFPPATATSDLALALRPTALAQELPTRQAVATARTQQLEAAEEQIEAESAKATDDTRFDPFQSLPILVTTLGVILLLLTGITLLTRRRL